MMNYYLLAIATSFAFTASLLFVLYRRSIKRKRALKRWDTPAISLNLLEKDKIDGSIKTYTLKTIYISSNLPENISVGDAEI